MDDTQIIDLSFSLQGNKIPLDHGYTLFSAMTHIVDCLHDFPNLGIHPIKGTRIGPGIIELGPESRLKLRIPADKIGVFLQLAGSEINLNGHVMIIGIPRMLPLIASARLASRMVTIKNMMQPDSFLESMDKHLKELETKANIGLVSSDSTNPTSQPLRRIVRIQGQSIVGFAVRLSGLSAEESIRIQEKGIGGRRHMGCGIFVPY